MTHVMSRWVVLLLAALVAAGCANQKEPATRAVADIEGAIASIRGDASKYAPAELQQVEAAASSLKDQLAKEDYKGVLAATPAVSAQLSSLQQAVDAKRQEAQAAMAAASEEWKALSAEVPQMVQALQSRVDILSQSKKLPKNVKAEAFEAAKSGLDSTKASWDSATQAFSSGDPVKAVELAKAAKAAGTAALQALGMA